MSLAIKGDWVVTGRVKPNGPAIDPTYIRITPKAVSTRFGYVLYERPDTNSPVIARGRITTDGTEYRYDPDGPGDNGRIWGADWRWDDDRATGHTGHMTKGW